MRVAPAFMFDMLVVGVGFQVMGKAWFATVSVLLADSLAVLVFYQSSLGG